MEAFIIVVLNLLLGLIYAFLIIPIAMSVYFLIKQKKILASFNSEESILERSEYYAAKGITHPAYIEEDIIANLEKSLDPYGSWITLITSRLSIVGLLGTFVGLSKSLLLLPKVLSQELTPENLVASASNAFITSIIGLFGALIISFFYRSHQKKIDLVYHKIKNVVFDLMYSEKDVKQDLSQFVSEIKTCFADNVVTLGQLLGSSYEDLKNWSTQLVSDKMDMIAGMVQESDSKLQEVIRRLNEERKAINEVKKNWKNAIDQLYKSSKNVASMSQNVDNFAKLSQQLIEKVDEFSIGFQDQIFLMAELNEKTSKPSELMNTLSILLTENLNQNKKIYEINEANKLQMGQAAEKIVQDVAGMTGKLGELFEGVKANFEAQLQAVEKSNMQALEHMNTMMDGVKTSFENQLQMLEKSALNNQEQLSSSLNQSNQQFISALESLVNSINTSVTEGNARLSQSFKDSLDNLSSNLYGQKEELGKLVANMIMLDKKLKRAFEHIINKGVRTR